MINPSEKPSTFRAPGQVQRTKYKGLSKGKVEGQPDSVFTLSFPVALSLVLTTSSFLCRRSRLLQRRTAFSISLRTSSNPSLASAARSADLLLVADGGERYRSLLPHFLAKFESR